jgi:hypothetical protein
MEWIDLTQDRDNWLALANTEINIGVNKEQRGFLKSVN